MAPASPQCSWTMTSALCSLPLKRDSMKSTCALTAARLYCVPPCSRKRRADGGEVGDLRNVQPDVLGQHVAEAGHDLFRLPALALEIDDVGLHEHGAAVAEAGEAVGAEGRIGILLHRHVEALRGGLQEVAVARRTLRVELEIFHAAVLQDDDLDVLAADVADDVHVVVEVQAGFGVGDGFDQRGIGADDVFQNVLGVAGGADAEDLERGALIGNLRSSLPITSMVSSMGLPFES